MQAVKCSGQFYITVQTVQQFSHFSTSSTRNWCPFGRADRTTESRNFYSVLSYLALSFPAFSCLAFSASPLYAIWMPRPFPNGDRTTRSLSRNTVPTAHQSVGAPNALDVLFQCRHKRFKKRLKTALLRLGSPSRTQNLELDCFIRQKSASRTHVQCNASVNKDYRQASQVEIWNKYILNWSDLFSLQFAILYNTAKQRRRSESAYGGSTSRL